MDSKKKLPSTDTKQEIKIKSNPKAEAIKKAPDEVIAMAIRDALLKDKAKQVSHLAVSDDFDGEF